MSGVGCRLPCRCPPRRRLSRTCGEGRGIAGGESHSPLALRLCTGCNLGRGAFITQCTHTHTPVRRGRSLAARATGPAVCSARPGAAPVARGEHRMRRSPAWDSRREVAAIDGVKPHPAQWKKVTQARGRKRRRGPAWDSRQAIDVIDGSKPNPSLARTTRDEHPISQQCT